MGASFSIVDELSRQRKKVFNKNKKNLQSVRPNTFVTPPKKPFVFKNSSSRKDSIFKIPLSRRRKVIYQDQILNESTLVLQIQNPDGKNTNIMYSSKDRKYSISKPKHPIPFLKYGPEVELSYEHENKMYVHNTRGLSIRHMSTNVVNRSLRGGEPTVLFEPPFKGSDKKRVGYDSEDSYITPTIDGELDSIHEDISTGVKSDGYSESSSGCKSHDTAGGSH